ncbi:MAG: DUF11 domain-containing protein [Sulfurovum sp.]|uniref:DUF11 domain-containing protein n=1 Tax=Sulfurovum sp. TaxID=1969726 RepID=UPI0028680F5B|nr:DUF11 domain-containing protein [Sulfurovum sp.]MCO4845872.1 DUF11 domain-containing protein [Sulfurovum sp.]
MKKISLILLFLGVFLLPITSSAALTGDECDPSDHNDSFSTAVTTIYTGDLAIDTSETYHFTIQTAGTLTLTPISGGNKVDMAVSTDSCPATATSTASQSITVTESTDINVLIYANLARSYTLTAVFTPAPLAVLKTVFPAQVAEDTDTSVTYTLKATNNTDSAISDLILTDTLPTGVTLVPPIVSPTGWTCSGTSEIICEADSLAAKTSIEFDIDVLVNTASDIDNTAELKADGETVSSTATIKAVSGTQTVDLEIQKFAEAPIIPPDTNFTYVIFVINHSNADAALVQVTDVFPLDNNVSFLGYDSSTGWTCTTPTTATGNTFTCDFNRSMGKEIAYFTINAKTDAGDYNTTAINTATVSALNPIKIDVDHPNTDTAIISIETNATYGGGTLGGKYVEGGSIEVSDIALAPSTTRFNARIQTKVASTEAMTLPTYFVDYETDLTSSYTSDAAKVIPVTVLLKLADDDCTVASETYLSHDASPVAVLFNEGDSLKYAGSDPQNGTETFTMRNIGQKKAKLIMKYVDINKELDYSGESCSVSNLSANIKGLPQCIANSAGSNKFDNNKYINVFGIEAFIRCNLRNGSPCNSSNGGYGDDPYDNEYGCYECTVGSAGYCSHDNFAIRPKAFDVNITDGDFFRAGKDYSLSFKGLTANTSITDETTLDYNETQIAPESTPAVESETFSVDANVTNNTNCQVKYLTNDPLVQFQDGLDDDAPFKFDDIGDINFTIHETDGTEFAKIDQNDTDIAQRLIEDFNVNFTVIPFDFNITATLADHNDATNLTYLHDINRHESEDNHSMASTLTIDIAAMGEDDDIASNYTEGCYAKDTSLTLGLDGTNIIYPGSVVPLTHFLYYNPVEDNGSIHSGEGNYTLPAPAGNTISIPTLPIENIASSFPPSDEVDKNGTTSIAYKLNFDRKIHLVVNPVKMTLSDVNITDTDNVEGTTGSLTDQNATFYYARTRASKFFYEDISEPSVSTPIIVDVYCDLSFTVCDDDLGIDTVSAQINEINWWLSLGHRTANNDGNITLIDGNMPEGNSDNWSVTPTVNITANAIDTNIAVSRGTTNLILPLTVEIDLDEAPTLTNRWLIYNEDTDDILRNAPSPLYKVRFIGTSGWAGHGKTGHVVDSNVSIKKHRRLGW